MLSPFAPMTMYVEEGVVVLESAEDDEGAEGRHGYAFVGTMPVTDDPEGPRIYSINGCTKEKEREVSSGPVREGRIMMICYLGEMAIKDSLCLFCRIQV